MCTSVIPFIHRMKRKNQLSILKLNSYIVGVWYDMIASVHEHQAFKRNYSSKHREKKCMFLDLLNLYTLDNFVAIWFFIFVSEVVCRSFGHEHGISLCCGPYGYSTIPMATFRPKCNGTENKISDCEQVRNGIKCRRQNYASVVCYNGTRPVDGKMICYSVYNKPNK